MVKAINREILKLIILGAAALYLISPNGYNVPGKIKGEVANVKQEFRSLFNFDDIFKMPSIKG